jgi:TRAP-type C4-dicarboxylate transport system permease small subunit
MPPQRARLLVRIVAFLLFLQFAIIIGMAVYAVWPDREVFMHPTVDVTDETGLTFGVAFLLILISLMVLVAALGVLFLPSRSWLVGMLAQVVVLGICLLAYTDLKSTPLYVVMLTGVLMVFYLNSDAVRRAFKALDRPLRREAADVI